MNFSSAEIDLGVLSGWGIAPDALARIFPAGTVILPPTRENALRLAETAKRLVGYSLGAWILLETAARGENFRSPKTTLYAPFLAFPKEAKQGGKIFTAQIKFLRRWIKKDPLAAIADFYARAELNLPAPREIPYRIEDLDTGLEILTAGKISAVPAIAENWEIVLGENDALLDAGRVAAAFPRNRVRKISAGTHDLRSLIF